MAEMIEDGEVKPCDDVKDFFAGEVAMVNNTSIWIHEEGYDPKSPLHFVETAYNNNHIAKKEYDVVPYLTKGKANKGALLTID